MGIPRAARRWPAVIRQAAGDRKARAAIVLWIVCAVVVWNVVFDRVLVLAGRRYVHAAAVAAGGSHAYEPIDAWMRPAVAHGLWTATTVAGLTLLVGLIAIGVAVRRRLPSDT
jgi:hypothetical protein